MDVEKQFVSVTSLVCEPARSAMLWNLLDGRAYTAGELAASANISASAASNHLTKLLEGNIVKVEIQGRHRYYSFAGPDVAYAVESLAMLAKGNKNIDNRPVLQMTPITYCRSCYDHLAGYVGVQITEALEQKGCIEKTGKVYHVSKAGWDWFEALGISEVDCMNTRRPLTRQCLDWSERRPHLAGQLGALMFDKMIQLKWFRKTKYSRELHLTVEGKQQLYQLLELNPQLKEC
jgi:DNA-binding transcriptional ArsR family regulator